MQEKLFFYYTNDLHSNFAHWPQVAGYLKKMKTKKEAQGNACWIVDIGDHIDRVHPIAEAFMGKANVQLMNEVGYDIVTIGNNEGITLSEEDFFHLYDEADFQVVCANLQSIASEEPNWLQPHIEVQSVHGVKVGVIGLTATFNAFYNMLGWHAEDPFYILDQEIKRLKQSTDIIILLSHLGWTEDREIARRHPDIDVIIGGHTHHLLRTGEYVNQSIITAGGKYCTYVGEVILTWDHKRKRLVKKEAYTTNITHMDRDQQTENALTKLNDQAEIFLGQPVISIDKPIKVDWFKDTEIMTELTKTLREWTQTDIAMLNAGLLLDSFVAGDITYKDIHRICPHPINPCVVEINGAELLEVIRVSLTKELTHLKLDGFGFRGKLIGKMVFAGIDIETETQNGREYLKMVTYNGHPLQHDTIYSVATADTFTFGRLLPEIAKSSVKTYFLPEFIRDLLAHTLSRNFTQTGNDL